MSSTGGAARRRQAGGRPLAVSGDVPPEPTWQRTQLENGVRVVSEPVAGARSLSVGVWVGHGSRDEPAEQAGLCHLLEHLIFKGTAERDARSLSLAFDAVGGEKNAYTAK